MALRRITWLWAFVLLTIPVPWAGGQTLTCSVLPPECAGEVKADEAEVFYQAFVQCVATVKTVRFVERKSTGALLNERDLAAAASPSGTYQSAARAGQQLQVEYVLLPGICKLRSEFVISLRLIRVKTSELSNCAAERTRLESKFPETAGRLVEKVLGPREAEALPAAAPGRVSEEVKQLRAACLQAGADRFFPALWQRAEAVTEKASEGAPVDSEGYYLYLLYLCGRAQSPPPDMAMVPGGWVKVRTTAGERKLWVEPFFLDRREVSVGEYLVFLKGQEAEGKDVRPFRPITLASALFARPEFPITGVSWHAADAYARSRGKVLPSALQWMRAAAGDENLLYPCGEEVKALAGCNLAGKADGFEALAPASAPGRDESPFGVLGMAGNVREWTSTWESREGYSKTPAEAPRDPADGTAKVIKGGSWRTNPGAAACGLAGSARPGEAFDDVGLRCAMPFFAPAEREQRD